MQGSVEVCDCRRNLKDSNDYIRALFAASELVMELTRTGYMVCPVNLPPASLISWEPGLAVGYFSL